MKKHKLTIVNNAATFHFKCKRSELKKKALKEN